MGSYLIRTLRAAALALLVATPGSAQSTWLREQEPPAASQAGATGPRIDRAALGFSPATAGPDTGQVLIGGLPCTQCNPRKNFWRGFGELMAVQFIPYSINHYARDAEWADVSPATWWTNFSNPWVWDNNAFLNNQFSHPYHGNLYFNAGRANGYNFWASSAWAAGGSLMWEWMFEAWAPAPNDWLNTSLGGISLGEMTYRLSSLILDNTATGSNRVFREIAATLVNPVRGFNRLVTGQMKGRTANPPDWRPGKVQGAIDAGYMRTSGTNSLSGAGVLDQALVRFSISYGDQLAGLTGKPFSAFIAVADLSSNNDTSGALSRLYTRGNLAARRLGSDSGSTQRLVAFMFYEYNNLQNWHFGGQGFDVGYVNRLGNPRRFHVYAEALGEFMPIAAIRSDYYQTLEGRDYDYGVGLGGRLDLTALWAGRATLRFTGRGLWLPTLSGFNGSHTQWAGTIEGRYFFAGRFGVGASYLRYYRSSNYDDFSDVQANASQGRLFVSYALPRWVSTPGPVR